MTWVTDHPPSTVSLDSCVTCGLCLPVCPTYRLTGDETASPRGRLAAIQSVADGRVAIDRRFDEITSLCLQCLACETACPSLVPFGNIIESARSEAVAQGHSRRRSVRRFALVTVLGRQGLLRIVTLFAAIMQRLRVLGRVPVVGAATTGLRRLPLSLTRARQGSWSAGDGERVILFTGCVADAWFSDIHAATAQVLSLAGYRVELPQGQSCCGALASHSGFGSDAEHMARSNIEVLSGTETIVVNVAGCGVYLKSYGRFGAAGAVLGARTRDVTEVVASAIHDGRLPRLARNGVSVAVQDPCHLEHGQKITDEPRAILQAAGYEVVDVDRGGMCCGAAGMYQIDYPEMSDQLGRAKAAACEATGVFLVASANAGCEMQLRRYLDAGYEVLHPVEIYARALDRSIEFPS